MTAGLLVVTLLTALLTSVPAAAQPAGKKLPRVGFVYGGTPLAEMLGPDPVSPDFRMFRTLSGIAAGSTARPL